MDCTRRFILSPCIYRISITYKLSQYFILTPFLFHVRLVLCVPRPMFDVQRSSSISASTHPIIYIISSHSTPHLILTYSNTTAHTHDSESMGFFLVRGYGAWRTYTRDHACGKINVSRCGPWPWQASEKSSSNQSMVTVSRVTIPSTAISIHPIQSIQSRRYADE